MATGNMMVVTRMLVLVVQTMIWLLLMVLDHLRSDNNLLVVVMNRNQDNKKPKFANLAATVKTVAHYSSIIMSL